MALVCVPSTSVNNSQNVLPISTKPSLNPTLLSDTSPEEITFSRLLKKTRPVHKMPRKYSTVKTGSLFFITEEANNIEERRKKQRENKVKG